MSRRRRTLLAAAVIMATAAALVGCGRHVVVEPSTVAHANDRAWTVQSEPVPPSIADDAGRR